MRTDIQTNQGNVVNYSHYPLGYAYQELDPTYNNTGKPQDKAKRKIWFRYGAGQFRSVPKEKTYIAMSAIMRGVIKDTHKFYWEMNGEETLKRWKELKLI